MKKKNPLQLMVMKNHLFYVKDLWCKTIMYTYTVVLLLLLEMFISLKDNWLNSSLKIVIFMKILYHNDFSRDHFKIVCIRPHKKLIFRFLSWFAKNMGLVGGYNFFKKHLFHCSCSRNNNLTALSFKLLMLMSKQILI